MRSMSEEAIKMLSFSSEEILTQLTYNTWPHNIYFFYVVSSSEEERHVLNYCL